MRPANPKALNLSLNLVGALSLALAASSAEASSLITDDEYCSNCDSDDPQARTNYDHQPQPTQVAATPPAKPEAKTTPAFTPENIALAPEEASPETSATGTEPGHLPQPGHPPTASADQEASPHSGDNTAGSQTAAPVPSSPASATPQKLAAASVPSPAPEAVSDNAAAADSTTPQELAAAPAPTPTPETVSDNAAAADSTTPQELAAAPAPTPTPETVSDNASAAESRSAEAEAIAPQPRDLAAAPTPALYPQPIDIQPDQPTAHPAPVPEPALPVATDRPDRHHTVSPAASSPDINQADAPPVAATTPEPSASSQKPATVSLPTFVDTPRLSNHRGPDSTARPQAATVTEHRPQAAPKRPVELPRFEPEPDLVATDVMSVWNRFIPAPATPAAQDWSQDLPDEAIPATTVEPPTLAAPAARQPRTAPIAVAGAAATPTPSPQLPVFELPRPRASSGKAATPAVTQAGGLQAQADAPAEVSQSQPDPAPPANVQREDLLIEPLATDPVPTARYAPSPNAGIPSAFGAAWGDVFVSATATGADRLRNEVDGSISAGFGVGNPETAVGVEVAYNLLSIRNFAENGSFDAKVHRQVFSNDTTEAAVAAGWNNFVNYGDDVAGTESSPYGVVSAAHLLQPEHPTNRMPITGTLGIGGGSFSNENSDVGVLAGVGLQVDPRLSLNAAWSGVGLNVAASVAPLPDIPLTLNFIYGDITNNTEAGSVAAFTVGYGFNFGPRF